MNLHSQLNDIAQHIAQDGTQTERAALTALAASIRHVRPGAATALTDWEGSEVARLRAFAVAHAAIRDADPIKQEQLSLLVGDATALTLAA